MVSSVSGADILNHSLVRRELLLLYVDWILCCVHGACQGQCICKEQTYSRRRAATAHLETWGGEVLENIALDVLTKYTRFHLIMVALVTLLLYGKIFETVSPHAYDAPDLRKVPGHPRG